MLEEELVSWSCGRWAGVPSCSWHCTHWNSNLFHPPGHDYVLKLPAAGNTALVRSWEALSPCSLCTFLQQICFINRKWKYKVALKSFSLCRQIQTNRHTSIRLGNFLELAFQQEFFNYATCVCIFSCLFYIFCHRQEPRLVCKNPPECGAGHLTTQLTSRRSLCTSENATSAMLLKKPQPYNVCCICLQW